MDYLKFKLNSSKLQIIRETYEYFAIFTYSKNLQIIRKFKLFARL